MLSAFYVPAIRIEGDEAGPFERKGGLAASSLSGRSLRNGCTFLRGGSSCLVRDEDGVLLRGALV